MPIQKASTGDLDTIVSPNGASELAIFADVAIKESGAYSAGSITIPVSTTTSLPITMARGGRLAGLVIPSAFTGTAISFMVSADGVTYGTFKQSGTAVSITVAASDAVDLLGSFPGLSAWPYVEIVSNASESAARTIQYVTV